MTITTVPTAPGVVPIGNGKWRVLDRRGLVRGHVEAVRTTAGVRYRAQRFHTASRTFRALGDFWVLTEAVECVRLSR